MRQPLPPYVAPPKGPILQIEQYISSLRRRGTPEDELDRLREANKYTPPPPKPVKKKKSVIQPYVPVVKVLKPVVKKCKT